MESKRKNKSDSADATGSERKRSKLDGQGQKPENVASVLEKAKKALEMQSMLKEKLENIKKAKAEGSILASSKKPETKAKLDLVTPGEMQVEDDEFFDPALGFNKSRTLQRRSRPTIEFVEEGTFRKQAETARLKAEYGDEYIKQLEHRRRREKEEESMAGIDANMIPIGKKDSSEEMAEIPEVEWWDAKILVNKEMYPSIDEIDKDHLRLDKITHYIEHPIELEPAFQIHVPPPAPLKLTRREMKKLRTQRRQAREAEKQELIRQGLLEPPKPKVKISNLMRVLGSESTADPTAIELEVSRQMAERAAAHDDRNLARKLTPAERREKKLKKILDHPLRSDEQPHEVKVAVYKVKDLSRPQNRFKVQANARENHMSGMAIIVPDAFSVVIVEGGTKTLRRYEKLMLHRIEWNAVQLDEEIEGQLIEQEHNYCALVWSGIVAQKAFKGKFKTEIVRSEQAGKRILQEHGVAHYWDLAAAYSPEDLPT